MTSDDIIELQNLRNELDQYLQFEISEPLKRKDSTIQESIFYMGVNANHYCNKWNRFNELLGLLLTKNMVSA